MDLRRTKPRPISPSPSRLSIVGSGTFVLIAKVDAPPPAPYVTVTELVKLNGLVVLTVVLPPPEKLPPGPPVKDPRLISEFPLNKEEADTVPLVVPPMPVDAPVVGPVGFVKPVSVNVKVSDPAPVLVKKIELKSSIAVVAVPGALDAPVVTSATQEPMPPEKPI